VRWNALKHGLQTQALFAFTIHGEKQADFVRLHKDLRRALRPQGLLEELHVESAARCWCQICRSLRCEAGEIKRNQIEEAELPSLEGASEILDHLSIPVGAGLDGILRYRSAAYKQLSYHLAELERLQRASRGDHVAPPIRVQVEGAD
jgi:hypothetical protein